VYLLTILPNMKHGRACRRYRRRSTCYDVKKRDFEESGTQPIQSPLQDAEVAQMRVSRCRTGEYQKYANFFSWDDPDKLKRKRLFLFTSLISFCYLRHAWATFARTLLQSVETVATSSMIITDASPSEHKECLCRRRT
jgi:hypothetical protein